MDQDIYTADQIAKWCDGMRANVDRHFGKRSAFVVLRRMAYSTGESNWQIDINIKPCQRFFSDTVTGVIAKAEKWFDALEHADERLASVLGIPFSRAVE